MSELLRVENITKKFGNLVANEDVSFTLDTIDRHCVCCASGFCTEHSANSRSIGYEDERSPTLRAGVTPAVVHDYGTSCAEEGCVRRST